MIASTDIIIIVNSPFPSQHLFCHQIVITQHRCSPPAEIQAPGEHELGILTWFLILRSCANSWRWEKAKRLEWELMF